MKIEANRLGLEKLTAMELTIIAYMVNGYSVRETAQELYLTEKTVYTHRQKTYDKLNIRSELKLMAWFWKGGYKELRSVASKVFDSDPVQVVDTHPEYYRLPSALASCSQNDNWDSWDCCCLSLSLASDMMAPSKT